MKKVRTYLFNAEHPEGKLFTIDADEQADLEADGWVDSPAKIASSDDGESDTSSEDGNEQQNVERPAAVAKKPAVARKPRTPKAPKAPKGEASAPAAADAKPEDVEKPGIAPMTAD